MGAPLVIIEELSIQISALRAVDCHLNNFTMCLVLWWNQVRTHWLYLRRQVATPHKFHLQHVRQEVFVRMCQRCIHLPQKNGSPLLSPVVNLEQLFVWNAQILIIPSRQSSLQVLGLHRVNVEVTAMAGAVPKQHMLLCRRLALDSKVAALGCHGRYLETHAEGLWKAWQLKLCAHESWYFLELDHLICFVAKLDG